MFAKPGGWKGFLGTCDTGTMENWITEPIVRRLNLEIRGGFPIVTTTFNGQRLKSGNIVTASWHSIGITKTHESDFRVVEDGPFDVLFGRNLLSSPEINYFVNEVGENPALINTQSAISVSAS